MTITLEPFVPSRETRGEAARVLGEAFITNPALVRGLGGTGPTELAKAIRFYELMLRTAPGELTVAKDGATIVGLMQVVDSDRCQPSLGTQLRTMPSMIRILRRSFPVAARWFGTWGRHDPREPHQHLGPIGVLPDRQGQGIGSMLVRSHIEELDRTRQAGYLETDKDINVRLYERFGYEVREELPVLGVPTWLMWRNPSTAEGDSENEGRSG